MKHNRRSIRLKEYDYAQAGAYFVTICTQNRKCLFGDIVGGKMHLNDAGEMIVRWYEELENKFPDIQCDAFVCMPNHIHFIVINTGTDTEKNNIANVRADLHVHPDAHPNPQTNPESPSSVGADLRVCPDALRVRPDAHPNSQTNPESSTSVGADLRVCPGALRVRPDALRVCPNMHDRPDCLGVYRGRHAGLPLPGSSQPESSQPESPQPGSSLSRVVQWFKTMTTNAYIRGVKQCQWPSFPGKLWQRNYYEHVIRNEQSCNRIREYIINNPMRWHFDRENPNATNPSNESEFDALIDEVTK